MMENLLNNLISNGYVFAGTLAAFVFILGIIYFGCNFTVTDYMSSWGRFLLSHNFKWVGRGFLWTLLLIIIGGAIFLVVHDFDTHESKTIANCIYAGVIVFMLLVGIVGLVLRYCRWCWGTMPLRGLVLMTLVLGGLYGAYLFLTHPAIPDGAIWTAFLKAVKLDLEKGDMAWRERIVLTDFQTYVSVFHNRWRTILYGFGWLCVIQLLLCNAWMHCRGWFKRMVAPVLSCLIASAFIPLALAMGFGGGVLVFQALILVTFWTVLIIVVVFMLWFTLSMCGEMLNMQTSSSSSGSYGGGSSYSSGGGSSGGVTTTYTDENGCEYKGSGGSPDTIEKQTPGDHAIFDKSIDGTTYKERFGDREVKKPWWMS